MLRTWEYRILPLTLIPCCLQSYLLKVFVHLLVIEFKMHQLSDFEKQREKFPLVFFPPILKYEEINLGMASCAGDLDCD